MSRKLAEYYNKFALLGNKLLSNRKSNHALEHMRSILIKRPLDINIETTNYCPMECVFCPNHKRKRPKKNMDMSLFNKVCKNFYEIGGGAVGICSMQSDIFSDVLLMDRLREISKYKNVFQLYTTTNLVGASRLNDDDLKFFLQQFDYLEISLGGLTREDYRIMFGVDAFDTVMKQLFRIKEMAKYYEINIMFDLSIRTHDKNKILKNDLLAKLKQAYAILNIKDSFFYWGGLIAQSDLPDGARLETVDNSLIRKDCIIPWSTLSVNVNGSVVGCGCVDWEARHIIGDMNSHRIEDIWDGNLAKKFRTAFSENNISELCRYCSLYTQMDKTLSRHILHKYKPSDGLYYKQ